MLDWIQNPQDQSNPFVNLLIKALLLRLFSPRTLQHLGSPTTPLFYIKPKRTKWMWMCCIFHDDSQWNAKGESADCGVVPSISFSFSTSGLSLRVRIMINYPRAAFFCVQTQLSPAFWCYLPACTLLLLPNKSCFMKRSVEWAFLGLKGPYRTIPIFCVCYFGKK